MLSCTYTRQIDLELEIALRVEKLTHLSHTKHGSFFSISVRWGLKNIKMR